MDERVVWARGLAVLMGGQVVGQVRGELGDDMIAVM